MFILLELVFAFVWVVLGVAVYKVEDGSDDTGEVEEVEFRLSPDPKAMDIAAAEALQWFVIKNTGEAMQVFGKPPPLPEGPEDDDSEWARAVRRSRENLTAFFEDGPQNEPEDTSGMDRALQLLAEFNATANPDENHREGRVRVLLGCYYSCSPLEFDPEDVSTLTPEDVVRNLSSDRWWGFREEAAIEGPTEAAAAPPEACWKCGGPHPGDQHPVWMPEPPLHLPRISLPRGEHHFVGEEEEGVEEACWKCGGPHPATPCRVPDMALQLPRVSVATAACGGEGEEGVEEEWGGSQASWEDYINSYPSDYSDTASDYSEPMSKQQRYDYDHGC